MLKVAGFFAGAGGIELAFKEAGFNIIYANEINPQAAKIYEANFFKHKVDVKDIKDVSDVPDCDIIVGGFPCQSFSLAGKKLGFSDKVNGSCFFELARIIKLKNPKAFMLENVKGLVNHDKGKTLDIIKNTLKELGYHLHINIYNAKEYANIPQNRERIFIIGFKDEKAYKQYKSLKKIPLTKSIKDFVDFSALVDEKYYKDETYVKYELIKDIKKDKIYTISFKDVRCSVDDVCPCLLASVGKGGGKTPFIKTSDEKIRVLTPQECFKLQGYPSDFIYPQDVSKTQLYVAAGNSVVVPLVKAIALSIKEALEY
ncbi:DNA (cytosine-5-)-methyltransferase [Campylobacter canadensis]|uniref:DNA (cytosine-5-)-methyltransferase n=1 Tax=Campylobacter canadensis TaxID=449520 RepID=UPI00155743C1|nr:DNA (cytosine-5-)-methyltransferase [Campylobacter canadensis]MBZ7995154.1 DNA (cytosine-5-)-methyltransferase [Campylobacter canadensis]MBZ8003830.1 DNA (cytosine-5-)-methyltransferase [Campylobacter canadensis]